MYIHVCFWANALLGILRRIFFNGHTVSSSWLWYATAAYQPAFGCPRGKLRRQLSRPHITPGLYNIWKSHISLEIHGTIKWKSGHALKWESLNSLTYLSGTCFKTGIPQFGLPRNTHFWRSWSGITSGGILAGHSLISEALAGHIFHILYFHASQSAF